MPIGFLTEQQRRQYGRFAEEPTSEQLACYFHLDDKDRRVIGSHRGDHNRLGFAVQLCAARFLGTFLEDLAETPPGVITCLARQLGIEQLSSFLYYRDSEARWDHAAEIRRHCGFRDFSDSSALFRLNRWLYALCWTGTDRPGALFDRATTWLIAHKVLLPGVTVLERHVTRLRTRVEKRVWSLVTGSISPESKAKLESLLSGPEDGHHSLLDRLRKGPFRRSAPELVRALKRVEEVRSLGIDLALSDRIPPGRLQALARFAKTATPTAIQRLTDSRRLASLAAFICNLEACALDDALDLLDILITEIFTEAERACNKARLRTIKDLDAAAIQLSQVCRFVLNPELSDAGLRAAIFTATKRDDLEIAVGQVDSLVRPPEDVYYQELADSYHRVRRFLPSLFRTVRFGSTPAGESVRAAIDYLSTVEEQGRAHAGDPAMGIVRGGWRSYVLDGDTFDRKAYVFCCLDRLRSALRRRDLFVAPSRPPLGGRLAYASR